MKGIVLAGGHGTRLQPITFITNKHLINVFNRPMIEFPLETLVKAGIKDILIVSGREHAGHFINYLGSGVDRGLNFTYKVQEEAGGIAQALGLAEEFVGDERFVVILGDNVFEDDITPFLDSNPHGATIFVKEVDNPERFGVVQMDRAGEPIKIIEKPKVAPSRLAVTGLYIYNRSVFNVIKILKPSDRGELEITDVNNWYMANKLCNIERITGFWSDAGTFESLMETSNFAQKKYGKKEESTN